MPSYRIGQIGVTHPLQLSDFFEFYEELSHQTAAVTQLQEAINKADPSILQSDSEWYKTWTVDGKQSKKVLHRRIELDSL